jgi:hypothetical protein
VFVHSDGRWCGFTLNKIVAVIGVGCLIWRVNYCVGHGTAQPHPCETDDWQKSNLNGLWFINGVCIRRNESLHNTSAKYLHQTPKVSQKYRLQLRRFHKDAISSSKEPWTYRENTAQSNQSIKPKLAGGMIHQWIYPESATTPNTTPHDTKVSGNLPAPDRSLNSSRRIRRPTRPARVHVVVLCILETSEKASSGSGALEWC